jgi:hypothetical protein
MWQSEDMTLGVVVVVVVDRDRGSSTILIARFSVG